MAAHGTGTPITSCRAILRRAATDCSVRVNQAARLRLLAAGVIPFTPATAVSTVRATIGGKTTFTQRTVAARPFLLVCSGAGQTRIAVRLPMVVQLGVLELVVERRRALPLLQADVLAATVCAVKK